MLLWGWKQVNIIFPGTPYADQCNQNINNLVNGFEHFLSRKIQSIERDETSSVVPFKISLEYVYYECTPTMLIFIQNRLRVI